MANLSFSLTTVAAGALSDSLSLCQPAMIGVYIAVLALFVRDKRQMARVATWTIALSFIGVAIGAYGAFAGLQSIVTPKMAEFLVGILLLIAGLIEIYKHELLKIEPLHTELSSKIAMWLRRSTLPAFAFLASILQTPCARGPYPLLTEALSVRPGQLVELYLLIYLAILFVPYLIIFAVWYGVLSIPGAEAFKAKHRLLIRMAAGAVTASLGVYLLWHTQAVTLLPGLANVWAPQ
ncbi:MAG: hypothetical protein AABX47_07900 [Nanoarchaeota archaeon]